MMFLTSVSYDFHIGINLDIVFRYWSTKCTTDRMGLWHLRLLSVEIELLILSHTHRQYKLPRLNSNVATLQSAATHCCMT